MKDALRRLARSLGYDVVRYGPDRTGSDPWLDMQRLTVGRTPLVFDVGANVGQSVERFRQAFPGCTIHSFEPSPTTFARLQQATSGTPGVHLWNCALGASAGEVAFQENELAHMSSVLPLGEFGWGKVEGETQVAVRTLDEVRTTQGIEHIDILKSDTQGYELEVLRGAEQSLAAGAISLVFLEVIFSDMYLGSPSFGAVHEQLARHDFVFVTFYRIHYQRGLASWTDALFAHRSCLQDRA